MPNSRHRAASPGWPAEVSITMVAPAMAGSCLDGLRQREAIRIGHLDIGQHEAEGPARFLRGAQRGERLGRAGRQRGDHAPAEEHLFEQAPVRGVVVDDEDAAGLADRPRRTPPPRGGGVHRRETRGEMERASLAGFTLHPEPPAHQLHEL